MNTGMKVTFCIAIGIILLCFLFMSMIFA